MDWSTTANWIPAEWFSVLLIMAGIGIGLLVLLVAYLLNRVVRAVKAIPATLVKLGENLPLAGLAEGLLLTAGLSSFGWGIGDLNTGPLEPERYQVSTGTLKDMVISYYADEGRLGKILDYAHKQGQSCREQTPPAELKDRRLGWALVFGGFAVTVVSVASFGCRTNKHGY